MCNDCEYNKVYANYVLATMPPQYPWICSKCGEQGIDQGSESIEELSEYDKLVKEWTEK
jgi:hypothetical protein